MLKMLGRGVGPGALLSMRLDSLRIDEINDVYDRGWDDSRPAYSMDSRDPVDLWTLVRASRTLDGFLFAPLEGHYGARPLSRAEIGAVLAARAAELFGIEDLPLVA